MAGYDGWLVLLIFCGWLWLLFWLIMSPDYDGHYSLKLSRLKTIGNQTNFPSKLLAVIVTRPNIQLTHTQTSIRWKPEHQKGPEVPPLPPHLYSGFHSSHLVLNQICLPRMRSSMLSWPHIQIHKCTNAWHCALYCLRTDLNCGHLRSPVDVPYCYPAWALSWPPRLELWQYKQSQLN